MIHLIAKAIQRKRGLQTFATALMLVSILFNAMPAAAMAGDEANKSTLAPIKDPGILATGSFTFSDGSTLDVEIGGTTPGVGGHDQIIVNGTVTIQSNVTLSTVAWGGYTPSIGHFYMIIDNDGTDAVTGTFDGLAEGGLISNFIGSGLNARITYAGGDGNDVVITVVGEPEIDIQYPAGTSIPAGGTHDIGIIPPGTPVTVTYTLDNTSGTDSLVLNGPGLVSQSNVTGLSHSGMPASIPAGGSATWSIYFDTGSSTGPFHVHWYTNSNDSDEGYYDVRITGLSGDAQDIVVQRPAGTDIADGGSDDLGDQNVGRVSGTYTVSNAAGLGTLSVSDVTASNFLNATNFSLDTAMPLTIAAGGTGSFDVSFDVPWNGSFNFDMDVISDDAPKTPYDIAVSGTGVGGPVEFDVQHPAGTSIPVGGTHYIGNFPPGTAVTVPYTLDNTFGSNILLLNGPGLSSNNNVTSLFHSGLPSSIPAGGSAPWSVSFNAGPSIGPFHVHWYINSNDSDESYYDVRLTGLSGDERDIRVQRPAGASIVDGGSDDLGSQPAGGVNLTYTVSNAAGFDVLTVSDVAFSNITAASNLTLDTVMPLTIAAGDTGSFDVSFDVFVNGAFSFDMDVLNNDADASPYDIAVSGTGIDAAPEIDIQRPAGTSIADGSRDDLGTPPAGVFNLTYVIDNSGGTEQLSISNVTAANESNVSGFTLGTPLPINIPAGGTDTLDVGFNINANGAFSFDMDIANNDSDENPYDIQVSGVAADLVVVMGGNTSPLDGATVTSGSSTMSVEFNKEVLTGGAGVPGAADNPANYLLVEDGLLNNGFDTLSCAGGVVADDVNVTVDSVAYDVGAFTATVNVNGGTALPVGSYRLFVCGTTSVEDLFGNELNNGAADTLITFTVEEAEAAAATVLPSTGFAPGQLTALPAQPASLNYANTALVLEIPTLGQRMMVMSVPQFGDSWNVTWLGANAGYLSGTAFPTWTGNTVLTGHVWDAFNQPGPFADLNALQHGEQFYIHAFGMTYVYEVRENSLLLPTQVNKALRHEDYDWVTLLTCEGYDAQGDAYRLRRVVRAVLVDVR